MRNSLFSRSAPRTGAVAALAALALVVAGCGSSDGGSSTTGSSTPSSTSPAASSSTTSGSSTTAGSTTAGSTGSGSSAPGTASGEAATATSLADFGGMEGLEAAAKAEGALNVIALPPDWANYGEIIASFKAKYPEITVTEQNPNASSADEIAAAETNKGTDVAPDVFDLGTAVTLQSTAYFAPYKVAAWEDIPDVNKEASGLWVNDYTGTMAIGYDATTYGEVTSIDDLLDPKFAGVVGPNGNPTQAGAAFNGVVMAALANGGSLDDVQPGLDFFQKVKDAGNLYPGDITPAIIQSGEAGAVFDWSYNMPGYAKALEAEGIEWKVFIPEGAALGSYYNQAINVDAPHPAAARLWQEFLYSADAQNMWLKGGANPVLQEAMVEAGTINQEYLDALPSSETPVVQTADQIAKATELIAAGWPKING
ncbi:ABC transporter substrate-binding protein [Nakamurella deserti]|uniref:ABC transporter substrate-binding protein n=1 Tax=Nakamurella deserti TaxID=2164074 RepID=UPI00197BA0AB|nr:ABC transporter substrate-binding protein [Nakamurella deserti]